MKFLYGEFSLLREKCGFIRQTHILLNDAMPTFNYLLHQHIPESRTPGSQSDFTESKILCNAEKTLSTGHNSKTLT